MDAAFGAFAAPSPEHAPLTEALGEADSVCVDLRKRLRALPAWCSLAASGREGHAEIVRRDIALARRLGERLAALPGFRALAPVRLNVVCFTLAGMGTGPNAEPDARSAQLDARLGTLTDAVTRSGAAFLTPTGRERVPAVRAAFSDWRTTEADADRVADALTRALAGLG